MSCPRCGWRCPVCAGCDCLGEPCECPDFDKQRFKYVVGRIKGEQTRYLVVVSPSQYYEVWLGGNAPYQLEILPEEKATTHVQWSDDGFQDPADYGK